jgi:hypothetical protein
MLHLDVQKFPALLAQELFNVQNQHSLLRKELADIRMLHSHVAQLLALLAQELFNVQKQRSLLQKELVDIRQEPVNI